MFCRTASVGLFCITGAPMATTQAFVTWAATKRLDPRYLLYTIAAMKSEFDRLAYGSTHLTIYMPDLEALDVPLPPVDEQRRIADFLDEHISRIDRIIDARSRSLALLESTRASAARNALLGLDSGATVETTLPWAERVGEGWTVRRLSHLARMGTGHTPSRSNAEYWIDCSLPWLTTSDVYRFRRDDITTLSETVLTISQTGLENSAAVMHPAQTVALSRTSGSAGFAIIMGAPMATSQDFVTWTCGGDLAPRFLLGLLRLMRPYLLGHLAMGSTHKTIYFPDLQDIAVPIPGLDQQRAIGSALNELDMRTISHVGAVQRHIELLREYKQSLITAAVIGEFDVTTASTRSVPA